MKKETIELDLTETGKRLDAALSDAFPDVSRAQIQQWIKNGQVMDASGKVLNTASLKLKQPLSVKVERHLKLPFEPPRAEAKDEKLEIVFEDEHLLVINKPIGLSVHPGAGRRDGTLVNMLLGHTDGKLSDGGTHERPGIVHRLDKDTSGLMVVAKTNTVHAKLAEALKRRDMKRVYQAFVWNLPNPAQGTITTQFGRDPKQRQKMTVLRSGGKEAITHYKLKQMFGTFAALVECKLETGRTHQIRVHMAHIGCPVMGDPIYNGRPSRQIKTLHADIREAIANLPGQALHAGELSFVHPITDEQMHFTCNLPEHLAALKSLLSK